MSRIPSLQQIRETIRETMVNNLAGQSNGKTKLLYNGMAVVNQSSMWRMVQYVHEVLLPKIAKDRGTETQEYKNFEEIRDGLIMAMYIVQSNESTLLTLGKREQLLKYYIEENARLGQELSKYASAEQLMANDAMDVYKKSIVSRAISLLEAKPKTTDNGF